MRRLAITLLLGSMLSVLATSVAAAQHRASQPHPSQAETTEALPPVDVMQVHGLFDEIVVDSIEQAIGRSEANGAQALILQVDSDGAVVGPQRMTELLERIASSKLPVAVWVGPSRDAKVYGLPAQLFAVADATAMVPGSRVGHAGAPLTVQGAETRFPGTAGDALRNGSMSFAEARAAGLFALSTTDEGVPTVRSMVGALDGFTAKGTTLHTVSSTLDDDGTAQASYTLVRFNEMPQFSELMHTVASPAMAYLLFVIGLCLLVFEFFTAGVGIAGVIGAVCTILGCYGFAALPTRGLAIAALIAAVIAFAVDTQVGIPRFWTAVGIVLFIPASLLLYRDLPGTTLRVPWLTLAVGVVGVLLTFIVGMPSMVRTRFATPTIGREWMIGHQGVAAHAIDPNGVAEVAGAKWRARVNRATPISAGEGLRVVGIDGVTLDVEPLDGAARDYRDRRPPANDATDDAVELADGQPG